MSLKEIRHFLFARHGFTFGKVDQLVKELMDMGFITGFAQKFKIPGQRGGRLV
jgi:hypothetical protein